MDCFSSSPLVESFPSSRFLSPVPSPTQTEVDLPIEVDQSFNSSMSISADFSPVAISPTPNFKPFPTSPLPLGSDKGSHNFLSPTFALGVKPRRPDPVPLQSRSSLGQSAEAKPSLKGTNMRPPAAVRMFGKELSMNAMQRTAGPATMKAAKGMMLPPAVPDGKSILMKHRGGLPMQWSSSNEETGRTRLFQPAMPRRETEPTCSSPRSNTSTMSDLTMEVDSPAPCRRPSKMMSPAFSGSGSPGLGSFFCNSPRAPSPLAAGKRRSLVSVSPASPSASPSAKRTSFGLARDMDKTASSSGMLFGGGRPAAVGSRRPQPYKRPPLMMLPSGSYESTRSTSAASAFPILNGSQKGGTLGQAGTFPRMAIAPMRRAFSVCDQPLADEVDEDESEYEVSPSTSGLHAEYARRNGQRVAPHIDGSPGFKPMRSSIAVTGEGMASPVGKRGKKVSPYGPGGLPGFGDNEMEGKILPCHTVKDDGLVRITPETLDALLEGRYNRKVKRFHILDCRFDYEFAGGHIAGAVNVKSMDSLDQLLLQENTGLHVNGVELPEPSRSGQIGDGEQVVLVFHCEFSAKRAPTFAKHLRSRDRAINSVNYPKILYPEVYILEGGYCGFYKWQPERCEPQGYVPMDDPRHFVRRNSDMHDFRKFSRTRSFTYGETQPPPPTRSAPSCPPLAFAAASAAIGRRQGPTIIAEDDEAESSPCPGDRSCDTDGTEESPCPRLSLPQPPIFGSAKSRQFARANFQRVASYAGTAAVRQ